MIRKHHLIAHPLPILMLMAVAILLLSACGGDETPTAQPTAAVEEEPTTEPTECEGDLVSLRHHPGIVDKLPQQEVGHHA